MNNRKRDKNRRARLSLQNKDLVRNQLDLVIQNMGLKAEEPEVTEEEDPLKFFSQQQRKKEKEEEAKKYLHPIAEEDDPLKYFDKKEESEIEQDPLKFLKKNENPDENKVLGNLALHDEKKLAEDIKNNNIPEEIIISKKDDEETSSENKQKRMEKKLKTAMRLSQRVNLVRKINEKLLGRIKNIKKVANAQDNIKKSETSNGNTLLSAEEQIDPTKNNQVATEKKEVDLKNFMK